MGGFFYGTDKIIQTEDTVGSESAAGSLRGHCSAAPDTGPAPFKAESVRGDSGHRNYGDLPDILFPGRIPAGKRSAEKQISMGADPGRSLFRPADHPFRNRQPRKFRRLRPYDLHIPLMRSRRNGRRNAILRKNHPQKKTL